MTNLINVLTIIFLFSSLNLQSQQTSISGEYEWSSTYLKQQLTGGGEFEEVSGKLTIESRSKEILFMVVEDTISYSFKIERDSIMDFTKIKEEYNKFRIKYIQRNIARLSETMEQIGYAFLLKEIFLKKKQILMTRKILAQEINKGVHKFKTNLKRDNIYFEIFDTWEKYIDRDNVTRVIGNFNLDAKAKNYLECIFEDHNYADLGCCGSVKKGLISIRKLK